MTPAENLAPKADIGAGPPGEPASEAGPFVVNLCSSSTPMALPKADLPELKQFSFFVSRRFEEGRERFRLHLGYFETLAEAEGWLGLVRDIYPGAWAGEAPGKKLRARAAAAAAAQAAHAAGPRLVAAEPPAPQAAPSAPEAAVPAAPAPAAAAAAQVRVPTLRPAAEILTLAPAPAPAPAPATTARRDSRAEPQRSAQAVAPKRGAGPVATRAASASLGNCNIKEVLAALEDPDAVRNAAPGNAAHETRVGPKPARDAKAPLSDAQALQVLETRTQDNAKPAAFAVQLQWSVQPIALEKVPPLAIFSAYTLYCVEGSREGRKWHGLRLGFFNDPISAKQVAGYVRSEFASVAVLPVSAEERKRVSGEKASVSVRAAPKKIDSEGAYNSGEFKLFDADPPASGGTAAAAAPKSAAVRQLRPVPSTGAAGRGKVHARERRTPQTLEETLEILGAHELAIEDGKDTLIGAGKSRKPEKSAPFTRLLERLGERVRKS